MCIFFFSSFPTIICKNFSNSFLERIQKCRDKCFVSFWKGISGSTFEVCAKNKSTMPRAVPALHLTVVSK